MLEPPSEQLVRTLTELRLCTPSDFRRCRSRVKRLAHDLPAFDSIWIDALVQARKLTSFQSRKLESGEADQLRVGPCVLLERLGTSATPRSFLARQIDGNDQCIIKFVETSIEFHEPIVKRLRELIRKSEQILHPSIRAPHAFTESDHSSTDTQSRRLAVISQYVQALHLAELLVRRGRFPVSAVESIGRQLLSGLSALESAGLVHGDIDLRNVRLTSNGHAILVDAGVESACQPQFKIDATVPPEKYYGIAPELIGTGNPATISSDLYALGCLLWHLLAGRPPYSIGDPLALLAAHQTSTIPDVRQRAPDTPAHIATAIHKLTSARPQDRPSSAQQALEQWGGPRRADRKCLSNFRRMFETNVQRASSTSNLGRSSRWTVLLVFLFVLTGASLTLIDQGARNHLLDLGSKFSSIYSANSSKDDAPQKDESQTDKRKDLTKDQQSDGNPKRRQSLRTLPAPNAQGIVDLQPGLQYEAAEIANVGPLTIQRAAVAEDQSDLAKQIPLAEIIVTNKPLRTWSAELTLKNVRIRFADNGHERPIALLLTESSRLWILNCRIEAASFNLPNDRNPARSPVAVAWKPIDQNGSTANSVALSNSVFLTNGTTFHFARAPRSLQIINCLKLGGGPFFRFRQPPVAGRPVNMKLAHLTLRRAGPLIQFSTPKQTTRIGHIAIEAENCVFDVPQSLGSLIEWSGTQTPPQLSEHIEFIGASCLATADIVVLSHFNNSERTELDVDNMQIEGIATAPFDFVGPISDDVQSSELKSFVGPSLSSKRPGIDAKQLP